MITQPVIAAYFGYPFPDPFPNATTNLFPLALSLPCITLSFLLITSIYSSPVLSSELNLCTRKRRSPVNLAVVPV